MNKATFDELLLTSYKYKNEVARLKKSAFMALLIRANRLDEKQAYDWWTEFEKLSLIDKIHFLIDDDKLSLLFEGYCIGYSEGVGDAY